MISVVDPMPISNLTRLQFLDLSQCCQLTDESVTKFRFPELRKLDLQSNQGEERQNQVNVFHCFFIALTIVLYFICSTDRCIVVGTVEVATDFGGVERDPMCSRDGRRDRGVCEELATSALTQFLLLRPRHRQRAFRHYDLLPEVSLLNPQIPKIEAVADYHVSSVVG